MNWRRKEDNFEHLGCRRLLSEDEPESPLCGSFQFWFDLIALENRENVNDKMNVLDFDIVDIMGKP